MSGLVHSFVDDVPNHAQIYNMIRDEVQKQVSLLRQEVQRAQYKFYEDIKAEIDLKLQLIVGLNEQ